MYLKGIEGADVVENLRKILNSEQDCEKSVISKSGRIQYLFFYANLNHLHGLLHYYKAFGLAQYDHSVYVEVGDLFISFLF